MATKAQITAEEYLRTTFEHDAEFVHGEIVERSLPDTTHARIQALLCFLFESQRKPLGLLACTELRMKVAADIFRIPDVAVFAGSLPRETVPDAPPLLAIEILPKDDRYSDLMQKLEEYRAFGVTNIWVIDPNTKRFSVYTELGLQNASSLTLSQYSFQLTPADLFSEL